MNIFWGKYNCLIFGIICYLLSILFIYNYSQGDNEDISHETSKSMFIICLLIGTFFCVIHYVLTYICNYNKVRSINYEDNNSSNTEV